MKRIVKWLLASVALTVLFGCARTAVVDNIQTTLSSGYSTTQVKNAILKAGIQRQWIMRETSPGVIEARQINREHTADARINYSAKEYSITYVNSSNLLAGGGKIHKNYNRWVRNLDKDIQLNLLSTNVK